MKIITTVTAVIAIICLLYTLICGLWMKQQETVEASSINFHMTIGTASVILAILAIILLWKFNT